MCQLLTHSFLVHAAGFAYPVAVLATDGLTTAAIELLRCWEWPANALAALKCWVDSSNPAISSGMAVLEACLAGMCSEGWHVSARPAAVTKKQPQST